ncbi:MAG TPA: TonB-dependent receptor [Candidatus Eisenbacteria bacterium]|nr:TonB-dependent receptor [Candidatus Eisenbacteria bacterium]
MSPLRFAGRLLSGAAVALVLFAGASAVRAQTDSSAPPVYPRILRGQVVDAERRPVADARVRTVDAPSGGARETATDANGEFQLTGLAAPRGTVEVSRLGYSTTRVAYDVTDPNAGALIVRLEAHALPLPTIEVSTTRAVERESPVPFTELPKPEIQARYWAQDPPMLLAETPGVYAYSDAGNGVGYSYVKIRGFAQRRVAVTIDGIPLNDPESHEVYWVDHPDLLSGTASVQVQRGVGSALYGASAVGGSMNVELLQVPRERRIAFEAGGGSYGTTRFTALYQSGLLDNTYAISGRYSRVVSDGYREQSWSRLWAYQFTAARLDSWMTTRVNLYGGPEQLHLAYYAVDRSYLDGRYTGDPDRDRRFNPLNWRNETDNFFEPHYELINDIRLTDRASLTSSAFYFPGKGYYDDLPYGPQSFASRQLPSFYVPSDTLYPAAYYLTDSLGVPEAQPNGQFLVTGSDMTQRLWVRNRHYGWVPRARLKHEKGELTLGGEWREHDGRHWGELTWSAALPPGTEPNHVFYDYTGRVRVLSGFAQEAYNLRHDVRLTGSLQLRSTRYAIGDDRYNGYDFHLNYSFLNPRVGVNWNPNERWNAFASFAYVRVEPILSEIYRADDPTSVPLFRRLDPANHIYEDPLIDPEHLRDFEAGLGWKQGNAFLRLTGFWLDFRNEIVPFGQIDVLGNPITGNAARSAHKGVEAELGYTHRSGMELSGNATFGKNRFGDYREFIAPGVFNDYSGNAIAGFPDRMANVTVGYRRGGSRIAATMVETGRQYLDNSEDNRRNSALRAVQGYQHKFVEEHAVLNAALTLDLTPLVGARALGQKSLALDVHGMNLTGLRYETAGYVFDEIPYFYPASKRSVFAALRVEF